VLDEIDVESSSATVRALAEATLALVLFCDASRIDLGRLRLQVVVPVRLLAIGLPLTIALGALGAVGIFGQLSLEEAVILAVVLAPTDAGRRELIADQWRQVIPAAGAALAYGTAAALGGSGFIAAFVAGLTFRLALRRDPEHLNELSEQVGGVLNGVTFVFFGAILLGPSLGELSWELALYAALSLTLVRMLPVAIAMLGSKARAPTLGFLGWFGPRGLASIVFAVIVVEESNLPHEHLIALAIYLTVGLSVLAHGLSAAPLANRYARWYEQHARDMAPLMESAPTDVTRPRGPASQHIEAAT
jgi:NhaP-type Na+/H+ or K+/H+ antiporter